MGKIAVTLQRALAGVMALPCVARTVRRVLRVAFASNPRALRARGRAQCT